MYSRHVPPDQKFFNCKCWQCIDKDELKAYIQTRQRRLEKKYANWKNKQEKLQEKITSLKKKQPVQAPPRQRPAQRKLFVTRKIKAS